MPVNVGLSNREGSLPFHINRSNIGGSQIIDVNHESIEDAIKINVKPLDQLNELKDARVALIKVDVEGSELNVLKGAKDTISKNMPAILFEQSAPEIINGSSSVIKYLEDLGYEFFIIKKNFYFGESVVAKLTSLVCRSLFGERLDFVEVKAFRKTSYDMILGMPKS